MKAIFSESGPDESLALSEATAALDRLIDEKNPRRVLILPPDVTRVHSLAGPLTAHLYARLKDSARVDIMPAVGSHLPMTRDERVSMFGDGIPDECYIHHDWRRDVVTLGTVPGSFIEEVSEGLLDYSIAVQVNRRFAEGGYDLILSLGQVVPHEVVGIANYSKNIFVGIGGSEMIHRTHFLGAVYGMERLMGRDHSPVRRVFDYAQRHFLSGMPLWYGLTVIGRRGGSNALCGFYLGQERDVFEAAVRKSQAENLTLLDRPPRTIVCWLDEEEFRSTWVGNKAIYRTRMAIADGGNLVIFAPGIRMLGEDPAIDPLLRKYGYTGRDNILRATRENDDLKTNLSAAAHLIHGSSDGRFTIRYAAPRLSRAEIENEARFAYIDWNEAMARYTPDRLTDGYNTLTGGEEVLFVSNPALGLWASRERFEQA